MSGLPARFPRQSLYNQASQLDQRLHMLAGQVESKIEESENQGLGNVTRRLNERLQALREAQILAVELTDLLYLLP